MTKGWRFHYPFVTGLAALAIFGYTCSLIDGWTKGAWDVPFKGTAVGNAIEFWLRGPDAVGMSQEQWMSLKSERMSMFVEEDDWKTWLILNGLFRIPTDWTGLLPRFLQCWLRNMLATYAVYFAAAIGWVYYAYWIWGNELYNKGKDIPSLRAVGDQVRASCVAIPGYALLPTVTEWLIENGYTIVYPRISSMGVGRFVAIFALYISLVEFGVYWAHRLLHDWTAGYRLLHSIHHKYNKENTLSPFASLAFHWLDGVCQGASYCLLLPMIPMHFMTHEVLLFFTGLWTTNIHDCLHAKIMPIMGAGYHTIHHTTYKHNYGHYTIYFDYLYDTLTHPEDFEGIKKLEETVYEELAKEEGVSPEEYQKRHAKRGQETPATARHSPMASAVPAGL